MEYQVIWVTRQNNTFFDWISFVATSYHLVISLLIFMKEEHYTNSFCPIAPLIIITELSVISELTVS